MIDAAWAKPTRTLSRRSAGVVSVPLGLVTFVLSLVFAAVLHLDLPASRKMARDLTVQFFNGYFSGQIAIEEIRNLGVDGLLAAGVTITDPQSRPVIQAAEVQADVGLTELVLRLLGAPKKIDIELDKVTLRRPAVFLLLTKKVGPDGEPLGYPSIADAFDPRNPKPDTAQSGTPVRLWFPEVRLERSYVRGRIGPDNVGEVNVPLAEATVLVTDKGVRVEVERFGLRASGFGGVDTLAVGEVRMRLPGAIDGSVRGKIGAIPLSQTFRLEGDRLLIEGSLPTLEASALRPLFADWPLEGTIGVKNRIEGTLPRLNADVVITAGNGQVHAAGLITTAPGLEADLDLDTKDLDLSALGPKLPQTRLNLRSAVEIWIANGRPSLELNATLAESEYQGTPLPVVDLMATYDERGLSADATLHERGLPIHLAVSGEPGKRLDFDLDVRRTSLEDSPRLKALVDARGEVSGQVKGNLQGTKAQASWTLAGRDLSYGALRLGSATSSGQARVDLSAPEAAEISADVEAKDLGVGERVNVPNLKLHAVGPVLRPAISLDATTALGAPVHLAATVHPDWPGVSNLSGHVGSSDKEVGIELERLSAAGGEVHVRGLALKSGGFLKGDLVLSSGAGEVRLAARSFDLRTLVASFGLDRASLSGRLDLDVDAKLANQSSGRAHLVLKDASILGVAGLKLDLETNLDGQRLVGQGSFEIEGVAKGATDWDVKVAGPIASQASYPGATGTAHLGITELELAWISTLLPESVGVRRASGTLNVDFDAAREDPSAFPDLRFRAKTTGLSVDIGKDEDLRRVDALDLSLRGSVNHKRQRLEAALGVTDSQGDIVTGSGGIELPLDEWVTRPPEAGELAAIFQAAPIECVVLLPERRIVDFPPALRLPSLDGHVAGRAVVRGSIEDAEIDVNASVLDLQGDVVGMVRPVSIETSARYRPKTGRLGGSLQARQGSSRVASAAMKVVLPLAHLQDDVPEGTAAWTGAAQVVVEDAPLGLVAALTEQHLSGAVQGSIGITRKGYPIDVDASLRLRQLILNDTPLGEGEMVLAVHDDVLRTKARLEDEFGNLEAQASLAVRPSPWALSVDRQSEIELGVSSSGHDAAVLQPFVASTLSELSGELNGSLQLRLRPGKTDDAPMDAALTGQMTMQDGVITPSAMGLRLTDTNFSVIAAPQGQYNVIRLSGLRAKARSEQENLRGEGELYLKGLSFDHANFRLEQKRLPLMKDGALVATVTGTLRGELVSSEERQDVKLDLSGLTVDLPSVADADVIELEDNSTIEIVQRPRKEVVKEAKSSAQPLRVVVDLGSGVKVESSLFKVVVRGRPEVEIAETTSIHGRVELAKGGTATVLGKVFLVEEGVIAFDTFESTNPHLDISATWRASSGVLVRAKISGTARSPKLEWSSEPALAGGEAEVIALVIGGGGGSTKSGTGQGQGVAMAGMALAVNQLIGETGLRNVEVYAGREAEATEGEVARLSQRSWDSYTASIQLSEELWFQGSYKQESGGPASQSHAGVSGTLDWRFAPNWSASTEIGMLGVGADLLWQYRY